ncbi:hypothetical protein A1O3_01771 [Capronia epimyces CBS 606.96]|uniref:Aldehyde dehydrogenase domain-containing protein n=1 Tax=Capronia epimyces CBS 606.96 TaxID=1182542 RepID=W9ZFB7_9EURO|nr:uncharacterized protein A1O3_01771 [Capronia epimyces CBS 606.96]EXJ93214.1 hypothetical protein A1O3_01771 [Capronia epimyces CBS 606.96]
MARHYQTLNPATGKVVQVFPQISDQDVQTILNKASDRYENDWRFRSVADRASVVAKAAAILRQKTDELAGYITLEMGKLIEQSRFEVKLSADILEYYATYAEDFLKDRPVPNSTHNAIISTEPVGVLLAIEPWNFPYYQLARVAGPQLVVGNTLIVKHARNVPQCALAFARVLEEAGAPDGVYNNIFCGFNQINTIIDDFRVRGVTLTGSEKAGAAVAERAGRQLKKVVLELGGSDPFIVLEDADIEDAVAHGAEGRLVVMGQCCVASKRFIVVGQERGRRFLEHLTKAFASLKVGDPADSSTSIGPLVSEEGLDTLLKQIESAKAHGARVVTGGKRIDRPGFYVEPTVITDITEDNPLFQEETFGPVVSFYIVDNEEQAIKLANATKFGLGASIFSRDTAHAQAVAKKIDSGMVSINATGQFSAELPFGGVKNSGFGRELGDLGIGEFVNRKIILTRP